MPTDDSLHQDEQPIFFVDVDEDMTDDAADLQLFVPAPTADGAALVSSSSVPQSRPSTPEPFADPDLAMLPADDDAVRQSLGLMRVPEGFTDLHLMARAKDTSGSLIYCNGQGDDTSTMVVANRMVSKILSMKATLPDETESTQTSKNVTVLCVALSLFATQIGDIQADSDSGGDAKPWKVRNDLIPDCEDQFVVDRYTLEFIRGFEVTPVWLDGQPYIPDDDSEIVELKYAASKDGTGKTDIQIAPAKTFRNVFAFKLRVPEDMDATQQLEFIQSKVELRERIERDLYGALALRNKLASDKLVENLSQDDKKANERLVRGDTTCEYLAGLSVQTVEAMTRRYFSTEAIGEMLLNAGRYAGAVSKMKFHTEDHADEGVEGHIDTAVLREQRESLVEANLGFDGVASSLYQELEDLTK